MPKEYVWNNKTPSAELSDLIGKVVTEASGERIEFEDGSSVRFWHDQSCCESVDIESVDGDFADLVGQPLLMCEEVTNADEPEGFKQQYGDDSHTWTFYKFASNKGYVTVRWLGLSNGYYGEEVSWRVELGQKNSPD